ncbi:hypothetical protein AAC387_Pa04g1048 [Persea americana]
MILIEHWAKVRCVWILRAIHPQQIRLIRIHAGHSRPRRALQERQLKLDSKMTLKTLSSLCKSLRPVSPCQNSSLVWLQTNTVPINLYCGCRECNVNGRNG